METLPIEILERISKNLTAAELASCSAVCHQWRKLFNSDVLWRPRCIVNLEEGLRTTPCVVEPPFVPPEIDGETLDPTGQWRLAYMRENHLWKNWIRGYHKVASVPSKHIFHTFFISNHLIVRVFDSVSSWDSDICVPVVKLYDVKQFPPALLKEITVECGGSLSIEDPPYYSNKSLILFYDECSIVFNIDLGSESIMNFKFKISLPIRMFPDGMQTAPRFAATKTAILGYNPIRYSCAETFHVWDMVNGTELKVEKNPQGKPYGFTDIITSETSENVVIVVSNDANCESFMLCAHYDPKEPEQIIVTYHFHVYSTTELRYLPFVQVFQAEHRIRYNSKILYDYVAIVVNGSLKIYNYHSRSLMTEDIVTMRKLGNMLSTTTLEVIDDCFAYISDHTFKMFHPSSQTCVALVELQIKDFTKISDCIVEMLTDKASKEVWKIVRQYHERLPLVDLSVRKVNKSCTRLLSQSEDFDIFADGGFLVSIVSIFKCPKLTEWLYYW